ncbi:MAG: prephenate dehydratase [Candidatus Saccharimonadales bacterium]
MKIAIQGQAGSFHDSVARQYFDDTIDRICCETFHDVFAALENNQAQHAVCAVENSLYGPISEVYDLLLQYRFPIVGEAIEHIHQQLIALPGVQLADITEVYSHPVALDQCREWLERYLPDAEIVEHHDTAGAVEYIKQLDSPYTAAIAGKQAAKLHNLPIIVKDIEDEKTNLTRFFIIDPKGVAPANANKASLVLTTSHQPGALYRALGIFDKYHINLSKLTSRPIRGERFRYHFFIDAECSPSILRAIIDELKAQQCEVICLGHYHASDE